jgi:translation initiation factor 2B subunit (eIF-2B alpha/beta/delta family)
MNNSYQEKLNLIINDYQSGSREIATNVFDFVLDFVNNANTDNWQNELSQYLSKIAMQKKSMAIVKNQILQIQNFLSICKNKSEFLQKLQNVEINFKDSINRIINTLQLEIFNQNDKYKIITCSYSSTIRDVLLHFSNICRIDIYLIVSIFKNKNVTEKYVNDFVNSSIKVQTLELSNIESVIREIDFGMIGSDAVVTDKYIINGFPSLLLAKELKKVNLPFYVVSEKLKFIDEIEMEDGFDKIPINLITKIITD